MSNIRFDLPAVTEETRRKALIAFRIVNHAVHRGPMPDSAVRGWFRDYLLMEHAVLQEECNAAGGEWVRCDDDCEHEQLTKTRTTKVSSDTYVHEHWVPYGPWYAAEYTADEIAAAERAYRAAGESDDFGRLGTDDQEYWLLIARAALGGES